MKLFAIENNGKKFEYQVNKLSAWDFMSLLIEASQSIANTEKFTAKNLMSALHMLAQTNVNVEGADKAEVAQIMAEANNNKLEFFYDVCRGILNNLTEEKRHKIFSLALKAISFNNGNPNMGGGWMPVTIDNVDSYIHQPMDVLLLIKESLMYNFMPVFERFFGQAPNTK